MRVNLRCDFSGYDFDDSSYSVLFSQSVLFYRRVRPIEYGLLISANRIVCCVAEKIKLFILFPASRFTSCLFDIRAFYSQFRQAMHQLPDC